MNRKNKRINQFIWNNKLNERHFDIDEQSKKETIESFNTAIGNFLKNNPNSVVEIGVQSKPGIKFQLNNSDYITLGKTGVFTYSTENIGWTIDNLYFDKNTFTNLIINDKTNNSYCIVDIIYWEEEEV